MNILRLMVAVVTATLALLATLPILLIGAPFWAVSALTRSIRRVLRWSQSPEVAWPELVEFVPEIGWKNRGEVDAWVRGDRGGRNFKVTTDSDGWRGDESIESSELIAFGDSFAFGHGVSDRAFFANQMPTVRTKALGVNGYNMVQELLWMERLGSRLTGKLVVWFVFYGNDLLDNLHPNVTRYRTPFVRESRDGVGWEIATEHVRPEPWPFEPRWGYTDKLTEICSQTHLSRRAYSACDFLIQRGMDVCTASGAGLAVVGIPDVDMLTPEWRTRSLAKAPDAHRFDAWMPDRRLQEMCGAIGVPFLSLSGMLDVEDHLFDDCHWTPRGHARVARALEGLYHATTLPPPRPAPRPGVPLAAMHRPGPGTHTRVRHG